MLLDKMQKGSSYKTAERTADAEVKNRQKKISVLMKRMSTLNLVANPSSPKKNKKH